MNLLDGFILVFLLTSFVRGVEIGFVRQFCSTAGFFGGLFLGALIESKVIAHAHTPAGKAFLALLVLGGCMLALTTLGEYIGLRLKFSINEHAFGNKIDKVLGSGLAAVTLLGAVWLGAAVFRNLPTGVLQQQIRTSRIVAVLGHALPSAPSVLTRLGHFIDPNGFPQVFAGLEPRLQTDAPLPDMGELNAAVNADRPSVVKIEGRGCGGIVEGSGFVADADEVVTNAHVVAGVDQPAVLDLAGSHRATVVSFDPNLDLAILRVTDVGSKPLSLKADTVSTGTAAAILGYPGGGGFTAGPAAVLESFMATGRNIYNEGETDRMIYSLKADVEQGNSGGPLIAKDGSVIGVVFAKSTNQSQIGYALTMDKVVQEVNQAHGQTAAVDTGGCAD